MHSSSLTSHAALTQIASALLPAPPAPAICGGGGGGGGGGDATGSATANATSTTAPPAAPAAPRGSPRGGAALVAPPGARVPPALLRLRRLGFITSTRLGVGTEMFCMCAGRAWHGNCAHSVPVGSFYFSRLAGAARLRSPPPPRCSHTRHALPARAAVVQRPSIGAVPGWGGRRAWAERETDLTLTSLRAPDGRGGPGPASHWFLKPFPLV